MKESNSMMRETLVAIVASIVVFCGFVISSLGFVGVKSEGYSIANHFVSELGVSGTNSLAWVFNVSLISGGILYIPFIIMLGRRFDSKPTLILGLVSAIACSFVGIFPAETHLLIWHAIAAMTFFFCGMFTALAFSIHGFLRRHSLGFPDWIYVSGLVVVGIYAVFLLISFTGPRNFSSFGDLLANRPDFLASAFFEWLAVLSINAWLLLMAVFFLSRNRKATKVAAPGNSPESK